MYSKIIDEFCREPLGEILFEKNGGKIKWKEGKAFICRTLGWSRDFPRGCGEPLKSIRYWRGLFPDS